MGNYFVLIYEFDDYKTIDLIHQDNGKDTLWLLYKEEILEIPEGIELDITRQAFKRK